MSTSLQNAQHPDWLPFAGSVTPDGTTHFVLHGLHGGSIRVAKDDVLMDGGCIAVKNGSGAQIVDNPKTTTTLGRGMPCNDCPSHQCACIGFLRVCCGSGGIKGACIGIVGC